MNRSKYCIEFIPGTTNSYRLVFSWLKYNVLNIYYSDLIKDSYPDKLKQLIEDKFEYNIGKKMDEKRTKYEKY